LKAISLHRTTFVLLSILLIVLFFADILLGSVNLSLSVFGDLIVGNDISAAHEIIILDSRIPKALTAILCGIALSISGLLMQSLFRNPLAGPYILGISSGAGLGVAILVMGAGIFGIAISSVFSFSIAAILGALFILMILFLVSIKVKDVMTLLILGVMLGAIATAIIGLIQYFTTDYQLKSFIIWSLGSFAGVSYDELKVMASIIAIGVVVAFGFSKGLNAILMGDSYATSIGFSVMRIRLIVIIASGILAGITTAFCGPIGFVGIVVPHLARLLFQSANHRLLIPACMLIGSCVLLFSDILSALPTNGIRLPINSITAILGIPVIIWILFSKRKLKT